MRNIWKLVCLALFSLMLTSVSAASVAVTISPSTIHVDPGTQVQFTASVAGSSTGVVIWSLGGTACSGITCGQINGTGLYTAPLSAPHSNVVTVMAMSLDDLSVVGAASVIIGSTSDVTVSLSPTQVSLSQGEQQRFQAYVGGTTITGVNWSLHGATCNSTSGCGTISTDGVYVAPAQFTSSAQVQVTATSIADPSKLSSATVTLTPVIAITISPSSAQLNAGLTQLFKPSVTGTTNTSVSWSVSGAGCNGAACGTISPTGLYTAPSTPPSPPQISIAATSTADTTKSASAVVTVLPSVAVSVSPSTAQVFAGSTKQFSASVTGNSNTSVSWSLSGAGCSGATCGTISSTGLYTAPATVPSPAAVSVIATSIADPTKSSSAAVTLAPPIQVSITPASSKVLTGQQQQFAANVAGTTNAAVTWSLNGAGCTGTACGTITSTGLYMAPAKVPSNAQVTITATSQVDSTKTGTAMVTIVAPVTVSITPASTQLMVGGSQQFAATVSGMSNSAVAWSVSGAGCTEAACGTISPSGLYIAPPAVPSQPQVSITATLVADPTKSSSAVVTIVTQISLTLSPSTATVSAGSTQQFTTSVSGSPNGNVTWKIAGGGCTGSACGTISSSGLYTAPSSVPTPAQITLTAIAAVDSNITRTATVTIVPAVVVTVSPASASVVSGTFKSFSAAVAGATNTGVTWTVSGTACTGLACGSIASNGLYGAPGNITAPLTVAVIATSVADSTKSGKATVTVLPPVSIAISPANTQVVIGEQRQFSAAVSGSTNTSVNWTVSGAGCAGTGCGTITPWGLYTAPLQIPVPAQIVITASSSADPTKSSSATVTLIDSLTVTISPKTAVIPVNSQQQFQASVQGAADSSVDWSVSGPACSGNSCGTIGASGLYVAPSTVPSIATIVITATSHVDASRSASASVNIVSSQNGRLQGQYAFYLAGMDASGTYEAAGTFTADGEGNITKGLEDLNRSTGPLTSVALSGSYQISADGRGGLTLSSSAGEQTLRLTVANVGASGQLMGFDPSGLRVAGWFERQDPSAFALSALKGQYVFSLAGADDAGKRMGALSVLYLNGNGTILFGSMDVNDAGALLSTFGSINGIYRIDKTGRALMTLSIPGFAGGNFQFAGYVVSSNKLVFVSIDPASSRNPLFGGPAQLQAGAPFATTAFSGPTVFSLSGETNAGRYAAVGRCTFNSASGPFAEFDERSGATVSTGVQLTGGYSLDLRGVGRLDLDDSNNDRRIWLFYAIAPNHAYLLDTSSAVGMGELKPQNPQPPITSASIAGTYVIGSEPSLTMAAPLGSGQISFDGQNAASGNEDLDATKSQTLTGTYSIPASPANGRAILTLISPQPSKLALWFINPGELVGMPLDSSTSQPAPLHFEQ